MMVPASFSMIFYKYINSWNCWVKMSTMGLYKPRSIQLKLSERVWQGNQPLDYTYTLVMANWCPANHIEKFKTFPNYIWSCGHPKKKTIEKFKLFSSYFWGCKHPKMMPTHIISKMTSMTTLSNISKYSKSWHTYMTLVNTANPDWHSISTLESPNCQRPALNTLLHKVTRG